MTNQQNTYVLSFRVSKVELKKQHRELYQKESEYETDTWIAGYIYVILCTYTKVS